MATNAKLADGVYYGWIMVAICMFTLMLTVGITMNIFGLYVLPVSEAYGLSRASVNTGMILMNAGAAVSALLVGRMLDRYPIRMIMGGSGLILAASLITLGLSTNIWLSAAVIAFPVGLAMSGVGTLTAPALVARWFTIHRGRAMGLTMMGMSGGTILIVPQVAWLIDTIGWRYSLVVLGSVAGVLISALMPFVRNGPGADDHETPAAHTTQAEAVIQEHADAQRTRLTTRQLLTQPVFWAIGLSTGFTMAAFQGILVSLIPIGQEAGLSITKAATLISGLGAAALVSKLFVVWAGDKFDRPLLLAVLYVLMGVASAMLLFAHDYPMLLASCALIGVSAGATMPLFLALLADRFGALSFGTANGNITFVIAVLSACAVRFSGEVFDRTGGYAIMFYAFIAMTALSAFLMLSVRGGGSRADAASGAALNNVRVQGRD